MTAFDAPDDELGPTLRAEDELPDDIPEEADDVPPAEDLSADDVSELVTYTLDWSVQSLLERIGSTFNINPAFQRRDAWNRERKSLYIESLMLGLPVPQVVLAEDKERKGSFLVLDGKQRLITMKQFAAPDSNFPALRLRKMLFLPQLNDRTFENIRGSILDSEYVDNLLAQPVRTIVLRNWQKPELLYQVFVRLNQNSVSLSPQELRQALFPGEFTTWINTRSGQSDDIHRARRIKGEDFRMRDAEMLLRSIAFQDRLEEYGGNLRSFLDDQCRRGLRDWEVRKGDYETMALACEAGVRRAETIFGDNAFLRFAEDRYIRRFNIAVFDLMTTVLSQEAVRDEAVWERSHELRAAFERLCSTDDRFAQSLTTSTKTMLATGHRVARFAAEVQEILAIQLPIQAAAERLVVKAQEK